MDHDHALRIADQALDRWVRRPGPEIVIDTTRTRERAHHWVFFYDTRAYLETRNPLVGLVGNVPVVVDKRTGAPWFARSRTPVDDQLPPPHPRQ
jgi:immunity protein 35 of polymorphic toxin system